MISALAESSSATVLGSGTKTLEIGANTFIIQVKAQNGSIKNYTIVVNRKNNDTSLKSLKVGSTNIQIKPDVFEYFINVDNSVSSILIEGFSSTNSVVSGGGEKNLNLGNNKFLITVVAESGDTQTYTININRESTILNMANLSSLEVLNATLSPSFQTDINEYYVSVTSDIDKLLIEYTPEYSDAVVEIDNPELVFPNTTIKIMVKGVNGSSKTYYIYALKEEGNYLSSLVPSTGVLSPEFNFNITEYNLYVPDNINTVAFSYACNGKCVVIDSGPIYFRNSFKNIYTITWQYLEEEITYKVNAYLLSDIEKPGIYLKSLNLENGKLSSNFIPSKTQYYYYSWLNFNYQYEPLIDSSNVKEMQIDNDIYLIVSDNLGNTLTYTIEYVNVLLIFFIIIMLISILLLLSIYIPRKKKLKKKVKFLLAKINEDKNTK